MDFPISRIINISVALQPQGVGSYNTSNLSFFTSEAYNPSSFGTDGFKIYFEPNEVGTDFGTTSKTYAAALKVFSQRPNILAPRGYFVVIPTTVAIQTITPDAVPASGSYKLNFGSDITAAIQWDATAAQIQTAIRTLSGLELATVSGTLATSITVTMQGYSGAPALLVVSDDTLQSSVPAAVTLTVASSQAGETLADAITRTIGLVQYFGILSDSILSEADLLAAAAVIQPLLKMGFFVANQEADVEVGGKLDLLRSGSFTQSRGLFYMDTSVVNCIGMAAAYASRLLSVIFTGSNTTITMQLKDLLTVQPDTQITTAILNKAAAAGADVYISFNGVPKVSISGANDFSDNVYNTLWFVGDLEVNGFNALATTATKLPQTEAGVAVLSGAYRQSCESAKNNLFIAPGEWNSPVTFGNQQDMLDSIRQRGYYIYSQPVALQSPADRDARKAPLFQIAIKFAGAINTSDVIVYVNK